MDKDLIKEIKKEQELNRKERLAFVDYYARWVKKTPNEVWSKAQNKLINRK